MNRYDVFVSYRREGGEHIAGRIRESLVERGYRVFLDVETLRSGDFNEELLRIIETTPNFVLICSPGCLDRCSNEGDWVRRELGHALLHSVVVPVRVRGFEFPQWLPADIDAVRNMNGPELSSGYYDAFVDRLCEFFHGATPRKRKILRIVPIMLCCALAIVLASVLAGRMLGKDAAKTDARINASDDGTKTLVQNESATTVGNTEDDDMSIESQEIEPVEGLFSSSTGENTGVTVRDGLDSYSWDELSSIAGEIESCMNRTDALSVAERYNLVGVGGKMYGLAKSVTLDDGTTLQFRLVDVWHDEADTASGRAGLSFLATTCAYHHQMSAGKYSEGGWEASPMRSWLSSTVLDSVQAKLRSAIMPVYKWSNNVGRSRSTSCVTRTLDHLWIPSIAELAGNVSWEYFTEPENSDLFNAVFNAEGYQYEAFAQAGVVSDQPNQALKMSSNWWLRSTAASTGRGRYVSADGDPSNFGDSNENWGVVFGFCL